MVPIQIVATIGPACQERSAISEMIKAGMSIARLNFSWGTHEEHRQYIETLRAAAEELGVTLPIIQDLSGPRIQIDHDHGFDDQATVITQKDKDDAMSFADQQVEYVAQSFVQGPEDILELRTFLDSCNNNAKIIAKIERQEAVDNLDKIIAAADGIMIARGDLGKAVPIETLPFVKKDILYRCKVAFKPVIVATEMLTSMQDDPEPNRADISDIAHAVIDGASATMLSNETAVGANPVEAVAVMRRAADEAQLHAPYHSLARF